MKVNLNQKKYEYEIKELIKAFGFLEISGEFNIKEENEELITILQTEGDSYCNKAKIQEVNLKHQYKKECYKAFAHVSSKELPWGILTGIRPVKLVNKLLLDSNKNLSEDDLYQIFKNEYYISEMKILDMLNIAEIQNQTIDSLRIREGISVYIGIPFCPSRCNYCSFFSTDINKTSKLVKPYIEKLLEEIDMVLPYIKDKSISSLYFGGGTPSALSSEDIEYLLKEVDYRFDFESIKEVCFEAGRPDTLSKEKLAVIKKGGVNRISINPQTMNDETLKRIGRNHNSEDIKIAFDAARELGFTNINMDIILGLEDETQEDVKLTMKKLSLLKPDSVTIHTLSKKRSSKLNEDGFDFQDNDIIKQMEIAREFSRDMNLYPYYLYRQKGIKGNLENLGLSSKENVSIYNIAIMEEVQSIIAFGAGGMSKIVYPAENRIERVENVKSLEEYLKRNKEMGNRKIQELIKEV